MTLTKTGRYYHQPDDIFYLKIPSHGDIPRVFRVMLVDGVEKKRGMFNGHETPGVRDADLTGLVVEDLGTEDSPYAAEAIQYAYSDKPDLARRAFERLKTADWAYLADFLLGAHSELPHASPSAYLKNVPEIEDLLEYFTARREAREAGREWQPDDNFNRVVEAPEAGDAETLIDAGILTFDDEPDLRTEEMKKIDAAESSPYSFPKRGRHGIIADLEARGQHETGRHEAYLGWYLDNRFCQDMSGKDGGYVASQEFDQKWAEEVEENEEALRNTAGAAMFDEWEESRYQTATEDDEGTYTFGADRAENYIVLKAIDGEDLKITPNRSIREICNGLPDETLVKLWKACRCLDHDVDANVENEFKYHLNHLRFGKEAEWEAELDATSKLGM